MSARVISRCRASSLRDSHAWPTRARSPGLSAQRTDRAGVERLAGAPSVSDVIYARDGDPATALRLRRNVRAFFQANRFLLDRLVHHVVALTRPSDPIVDLYAGVGLFGLALAAAGAEGVTLVEADPVSSADLRGNAAPFGSRVQVERLSVESFLHSGSRMTRSAGGATFVVDPPRTGMSTEALRGVLRRQPARIVYVSCDAPTLARDTRGLLDGGYALDGLTGFDLFSQYSSCRNGGDIHLRAPQEHEDGLGPKRKGTGRRRFLAVGAERDRLDRRGWAPLSARVTGGMP